MVYDIGFGSADTARTTTRTGSSHPYATQPSTANVTKTTSGSSHPFATQPGVMTAAKTTYNSGYPYAGRSTISTAASPPGSGHPYAPQARSTTAATGTTGGGHPYVSQSSPFNPTQYRSVVASSSPSSAPVPTANFGFEPALTQTRTATPSATSFYGFNATPTPLAVATPLANTTGNTNAHAAVRDLTVGAGLGTSYLLGPLSTGNLNGNRAPVIETLRRVPATHNHAGAKIALQFGGSDPIFQIGTREMFAKGKEPFLRLDVGPLNTNKPIYTRSGTAFPNNSAFTNQGNFLHYNTKGFNGLSGGSTPLLGNSVIQNHRTFVDNVSTTPKTFPIRGGTLVRGAGRSLAVAAVAMDVHKIATAENKAEASAQVAGGMAGAYAGAKGGAVVGATIGTFVGGPVGTAVGGFAGGLIGGAAGYWAGSNAGDFVYEQKDAIVSGIKHVGGFLAQPPHVHVTRAATAAFGAASQVDDVLGEGIEAVGDAVGDAVGGVKKLFGF